MRAVTELIELSHRKIEVCCFSDYHRSGQRTNALLVGFFSIVSSYNYRNKQHKRDIKSLTLSLEENLIQRGSSLITFFTSFHVVVSVIYDMNKKFCQ